MSASQRWWWNILAKIALLASSNWANMHARNHLCGYNSVGMHYALHLVCPFVCPSVSPTPVPNSRTKRSEKSKIDSNMPVWYMACNSWTSSKVKVVNTLRHHCGVTAIVAPSTEVSTYLLIADTVKRVVMSKKSRTNSAEVSSVSVKDILQQ